MLSNHRISKQVSSHTTPSSLFVSIFFLRFDPNEPLEYLLLGPEQESLSLPIGCEAGFTAPKVGKSC